MAARHAEGSAQTFLTLRSRSGQEIALGEFQQVPKGHTIQIQLMDGPVWRVELTSPRWPKAKR